MGIPHFLKLTLYIFGFGSLGNPALLKEQRKLSPIRTGPHYMRARFSAGLPYREHIIFIYFHFEIWEMLSSSVLLLNDEK
jgi:hypothetical protein